MGSKNQKARIIIYVIVAGIILWGFYIIQEEFAKYGMYQLISYGVHEVSSVIPLLCILVTILCAGNLTWCWIKKRAEMKNAKRKVSILIVMLSLFLCACGATSTVYTVEKNQVSYEVDTENKTIFDGTNMYQYEFSGNKSSYSVNITYPDGSTYWFHMSGVSGYGGWSDDYDEDRYVDGDILSEVLLEKAPKEVNSGNWLAALIIGVMGIFNIVSPYSAWYLEYGWRYKNAEPSDAALGLNRVVGGIAVVVVVVLLFV